MEAANEPESVAQRPADPELRLVLATAFYPVECAPGGRVHLWRKRVISAYAELEERRIPEKAHCIALQRAQRGFECDLLLPRDDREEGRNRRKKPGKAEPKDG